MNRPISTPAHIIVLFLLAMLLALNARLARSGEPKLAVPDGYTPEAACIGYAGIARSGAIAHWRGATSDIVYVERAKFTEVLEQIAHKQMPDAILVIMRDDRPYSDGEKAFIERAAHDGFNWASSLDPNAPVPGEEPQSQAWMNDCLREVRS